MILPIYTYGNSILRKVAEPIDNDYAIHLTKLKKVANSVNQEYSDLKDLISDMYETMYHCGGIGLAAPQIGKSIRILVIDLNEIKDDIPNSDELKVTMINPTLIELSGPMITHEEGCLSIPGVNGNVPRHDTVKINYFDEEFKEHTKDISGFLARVIQHEYDHLEGKLFIDRISQLKRQLISSKLNKIKKGKVVVGYKTKNVK